jgi:tRNA-2-methylthio-N6-dimethylallyladenosine synthase
MNTRKVYIETYGCQLNLADTELLIGLLKPHGYESTQKADQADVILLNTCAIREHAEERVLKRLSEFVRFKTRKPGVVLGLTGCMAQHHRELPVSAVLDLVLGPDAYRNLINLCQNEHDEPLVAVRLDRGNLRRYFSGTSEGFVLGDDLRGCDKFAPSVSSRMSAT